MNIDFVPFSGKLNHNRSTSNIEGGKNTRKEYSFHQESTMSKNKKDLSKPPKYRKNSSEKKKINPKITEISREYTRNEEEMVSPTFAGMRETAVSNFDYKEKKYENNYFPSKHSEQIYKYQNYSTSNESYSNKKVNNGRTLEREFSQASFRAKNECESENYVYNCEREKEAEERIERRKKKVCGFDLKVKHYSIEDMVAAFSEQARLDEIFRNNKVWFQTYKNDKKWQKLQSLIECEGIKMSLEELEREFEVAEQ